MKVMAYARVSGDYYELEGSRAVGLFEKISAICSINIQNYSDVSLYNDDGMKVAEVDFPSYTDAMKMFEMAKIAFPCGLAMTEELYKVFTEDFVKRMVNSWVAYNITERQGGFWVLQ